MVWDFPHTLSRCHSPETGRLVRSGTNLAKSFGGKDRMANGIEQIVFQKLDIPRLQTVLDLAATRQKLLTENVANAETPGYRRKDIDFRAELKAAIGQSGGAAMKATRPEHIGARGDAHSPKINREKIPAGQKFGVNVDHEMAAVAENQLEFNVAARLVTKKFEALRTVIRGR